MSIGVIGAKGNMGKRYTAVCSYLGIPWLGFDIDDMEEVENYADSLDSFLIATPTNTHLGMIHDLSKFGKPILCEKPIITTVDGLNQLLSMDVHVRMVNQYEHLIESYSVGDSYYDYYNSGKDDVFDFINIIGLSKTPPALRNRSPIWKCKINGQELNIRSMDHAYCDMIAAWHRDPTPNMEYIEKAHRKVLEGYYVRQSSNWDSSQVEQFKASGQMSDANRRRPDA